MAELIELLEVGKEARLRIESIPDASGVERQRGHRVVGPARVREEHTVSRVEGCHE